MRSLTNELRAFLLSEARFRAAWCVQAATAGGEAIARAVHLRRLNYRTRNAGSTTRSSEQRLAVERPRTFTLDLARFYR